MAINGMFRPQVMTSSAYEPGASAARRRGSSPEASWLRRQMAAQSSGGRPPFEITEHGHIRVNDPYLNSHPLVSPRDTDELRNSKKVTFLQLSTSREALAKRKEESGGSSFLGFAAPNASAKKED